MSKEWLLEVNHVVAEMPTDEGVVHILNDVSFRVAPEECFGLIGESGCGKSMTSLVVLHYAKQIGLHIVQGEVLFEGKDITDYENTFLKNYNGKEVAVILQNPMLALDPLYPVIDQITETIMAIENIGKKESIHRAKEIAEKLAVPEEKLFCYPWQLSGGLLQRIVGIIAISCRPKMIIADEPTTALDVTTQLQYLKLLKKIQKEFGTTIIFISHDIKTVSMMCDRIAVMYAGRIVEIASKEELFSNPKHPYTQALLLVAKTDDMTKEYYETIEGQPPQLLEVPKGCVFENRCPYRSEKCKNRFPEKTELGNGHEVFCWRVKDE